MLKVFTLIIEYVSNGLPKWGWTVKKNKIWSVMWYFNLAPVSNVPMGLLHALLQIQWRHTHSKPLYIKLSVSVTMYYLNVLKVEWVCRFVDQHECEVFCQCCSVLYKCIESKVSFPFLGSTWTWNSLSVLQCTVYKCIESRVSFPFLGSTWTWNSLSVLQCTVYKCIESRVSFPFLGSTWRWRCASVL